MTSTKQDSTPATTEWFTNKFLAVDTETTGLNVYNPDVQPTFVSWWDHHDKGDGLRVTGGELVGNAKDISRLRILCRHKDWTKVFFNAKFDIAILRKCGITLRGPIIDVQPMCLWAMPKQRPQDKHGLKDLTRRLFNDPYLEEIAIKKWSRKHGKGIGHAPDHLLFPYGIKDAKRTLDLFFFVRGFFDENNQWEMFWKEMRLTKPLMDMEEIGVQTDQDLVEEFSIATREKASALRGAMCAMLGNPTFNPNSPQQVSRAIYTGDTDAPIPTRFTKEGMAQTDKLALTEQPSKLGAMMLEWRGVAKTSATYLKNMKALADPEGVIHASINQNGTRTGRISCFLTLIPRAKKGKYGNVRACFVPRPDYDFLFVDYSQLEIRLQAHWTGEEHLVTAILEGIDIHDQTTRRILKEDPSDPVMRAVGKELGLAMQYGMGKIRFRDSVLAKSEGKIVLSLVECNNYVDDFWSGHPKLVEFFKQVDKEVADTGGVVNAFGRYMPVDPRKSYTGVNYKIQSTAADLIKERMRILFYDVLAELKSRMLIQVHDELVFEIHRSERWLASVIRDTMQELTRFRVPLTVDLEWSSESWAAKKPLILSS